MVRRPPRRPSDPEECPHDLKRILVISSFLLSLLLVLGVVLVHDASVAFSDVIQRTPASLMARGIYNELAVALYAGEHRRVSLHHVAAKMGTAAPNPNWSRRVWTPVRRCVSACAAAAFEGVARRVRRPKTSDVELLRAIELKGTSDRRAVLPSPPPRSDAEPTATGAN